MGCPQLTRNQDHQWMCSGSAQISDHQEHEDTGEQHASDHDELILSGSSFDQSHHRVGEPEHVGHVQHLLVCPLRGAKINPNYERS